MVVQHQRVMAEHIAIKRAEEKSPTSFDYSGIAKTMSSLTPSVSSFSAPYQRMEVDNCSNDSSSYLMSPAVLMDLSHKISEVFKYPWEMMPLLYVIMKNANGDINRAIRDLVDAQDRVRQYARDNNLNHF